MNPTPWHEILAKALSPSTREKVEELVSRGEDGLAMALSTEEITKYDALNLLSEYYDHPALELGGYAPEDEAVALLSQQRARELKMLPLFLIDDELYVAMLTSENVVAQDYLSQSSGYSVEPVLVLPEALSAAINRCYLTDRHAKDFLDSLSSGSEKEEEPEEPVVPTGEGVSPAARLLEHILSQGVRLDASDIHIEPYEESLELRYRIDGVLHHFSSPPFDMRDALVSRVKITSGLDIAERRLPQDGRSSIEVDGIVYDLRVSVMPNVFGEGVVIRIMDPSAMNMTLQKLGFPDDMLTRYERIIGRPWGILLVTGPTGSGKSTTLYATLNRLLSPEKKMITLEDPVEFKMHGLTQIPVRPAIGYTFASGLRSVLRHDPDIVMVGEIRDKESAEIAIKAALTGHFLFSTLHTNSATQTISRLLDMGLQPFQVQAALSGVLAQRLARRLCKSCRKEIELSDSEAAVLGLESLPEGCKIYGPAGCQNCNEVGYKGRVGIYELLEFNKAMKRLSPDRLNPEELEEMAKEDGFRSLRDNAVAAVLEGKTSPQEAIRLTADD